jgi:hypothetical protein
MEIHLKMCSPAPDRRLSVLLETCLELLACQERLAIVQWAGKPALAEKYLISFLVWPPSRWRESHCLYLDFVPY